MRRVTKMLTFVMLAIALALATWSVRALAAEPADAQGEPVETVAAAPEGEADAPAAEPQQEPAPAQEPAPQEAPAPAQPAAPEQQPEAPSPAPATEAPATSTAQAPHATAGGEVSPTTINNLTMSWATPSSSTDSVDANGVLQLVALRSNVRATSSTSYTTAGNAKVARAQLYFDISGSMRHEVGTVELRIPAHIFRNRDGSMTDRVELAASPYQDPMPADNENEFAWRLDNHGTSDPSDDEIVLVNVMPLEAASKYVCNISYTVDYPALVKDQTVSTPLSVSMSITEESGEVHATSNEITAQLDTHTDIGNALKSTGSVYEEWQSSWGTKPADADNYIYTVWRLRGTIGSRDSQPYIVSFQDTPLDHGGQVIGYSDINVGTGTRTYNWPEPSSFHAEPTTYQVNFPIPDSQYGRQNENWTSVCFVLVRYPKSQLNATGVTQLKNRCTYTLTDLDEGIPQTKTANATLSYKRMTFTAPPGNYRTWKGGGSRVSGGIERLLGGKPVTFDYFRNEGYAQGYELTLRRGGDPKNPDDYGQRSYHVEVVDDALFYEDDDFSMELGPGDYQINYVSALSPNVYDYVPDPTRGEYVRRENSSGAAKPDVTYYGQFGTNEWVELFTISYKTNSRFGTITSRNTSLTTSVTTYQGSWTIVYLAPGCTAVKGTYDTNAYECDLTMMAEVTVFPTERVLSYLQQKIDAADGEAVQATVTNVDTLLVYDDAGNLIDTGARYDGLWGGRIMQRDHELYGTASGTGVLHDSADASVRSYSYGSYTSKSGNATNDPSHKRVIVTYELMAGEYISRASTDTHSSIVADGYFTPQTGGTFYDLLPRGMEPDLNSVYLYSYNRTSDSSLRVVSKEAIEDWNGTGRTLLVVTWEKTGQYGPYGGTWGANQTGSLPRLRFDAFYPWEAAEDYGLNPLNSFAYETANESITNGVPDDATLAANPITEAALLRDLNGDGESGEGAPTTFLYGQAYVNVNGLFSSLASLQKHVRMGHSGTWKGGLTEDLTTHAGGSYQYRLRYVTAAGTRSRNIVLYDSLESYKPNRDDLSEDYESWILDRDVNAPTWQGTFAGLDLTQVRARGIAPVVYYSTVDGLDIGANRDITDTSVWVNADDYTGDLADVRAVAVDLSKKTDGTPYTLDENQSVVVLVNMKAPADPHEANAYAYEGAAAFNQDWVSSTIGSSSGSGESEDTIIHTEYTRVLLTPVNVDIPVEKVWEDDNDRDGLRPDSVTVRLLADGEPALDAEGNELTLELSEENDWQGTFEDLPEYVYQEPEDPEGEGSWHKVEYTLEEIDVPEGYEFECSGDSLGLTATNTHKPQTTSISVVKVWQDGEDEDGIRPLNVFVRLLADGEPVLDAEGNEVVLELTADGGWDGSFDELPVYRDGGEEIVYTVEEIEVAEGYEATVEGTPEDGFTITNTHEPVHEGGDSGEENPPDDKPDDGPKPDTPGDNGKDEPGGSSSKQDSRPRILPRTMDDLIDALPLLGVGAAVLLAGVLLRRRKS